jgi:glycolate oxidase FAD binding subunit
VSEPAASLAADLRIDGQPIRTRPPSASDSVDGVVPGVVVEPESAAAVAAVLQWAASHSQSVLIRGGGTKRDWGARPSPVDVLLDVSRLRRILRHQSGDLTVSVEAGVRLRDLNEALARHGQWLPLDPPFGGETTIGGLLATNDSGPQRHRFGTPRDLVIGIEVATMAGQLAKAGGQVVKNVAGYDLSKIMSGSFGTLAAIVSATFKLSPISPASGTIVIEHLTTHSAVQVAETIAASQLEPVAFDIVVDQRGPQARGITILLRFASFPAVVDAEIANATARIAAVHQSFHVIDGDDERQLWRRHTARPFDHGAGILVRGSWLPANLDRLFAMLDTFSPAVTVEMIGRIAVGAGLFRIEGHPRAKYDTLTQMRASDAVANITVRRGRPDLKSREWVWGTPPGGAVAAALKRELDPRGLLGAGRGPL